MAASSGADERVYLDGAVYAGEWSGGHATREGMGTLHLSTGVNYSGQFSNGLYDGLGVLEFPVGESRSRNQPLAVANYMGQLREGKFDGVGVLRFSNGSSYTGEFSQGHIHGSGKFELPADGQESNPHLVRECEGQFEAGQMVARGCSQSVISAAISSASEATRVAERASRLAVVQDNVRL